jgi:hypothetical protein
MIFNINNDYFLKNPCQARNDRLLRQPRSSGSFYLFTGNLSNNIEVFETLSNKFCKIV